ncbi:tyrosyl-DNA phosphodiesterase [Plectosphaerella plurivora]|uniref:Tyrosyl-DNA phosphodiesterase n=1 Tax=Plectosphaerella plurivora TaxID=936078 RepID=A0A9P8VHZ0_9PEZI|nr:tyrosyl-DNA phosphodiesterase [Plectosphaerella plurivora]
MEPSPKRRRLDAAFSAPDSSPIPESLSRPISPPPKRTPKSPQIEAAETSETPSPDPLGSPFQLTHIRDLPDTMNQDAVTLHDLLGDPLIAECWVFNFLHDIPFVMSHFDDDTRHLVKVRVVHGFWKREDANLAALKESAAEFPNVELLTAPMPGMFGTHHSKMFILFRHDDSAQVVIHTANMIAKDWTNMTNALWKSPQLPLLPDEHPNGDLTKLEHNYDASDPAEIGGAKKFKIDLLRYLRAYNARKPILQPLMTALVRHDFSDVRAALIASVPGKHHVHDRSQTAWGWPALKAALRHVPVQGGKARVVVQISSIATLGGTDAWIQKCLFDSLSAAKGQSSLMSRPSFKVVFPTPDEIRRSLDGYASGGSIHTKTQSPQQAKQLRYLHPMFCHWANDASEGKELPPETTVHNSGRQRAAPHIKTYIRYGDKSIDWALLTSANVSKQAWGEAENAYKEVKIASWEIGVLVWPSLLTGSKDAKMVGTFQQDMPSTEGTDGRQVVGLRIPYSLPLQAYGEGEIPWVATLNHVKLDSFGGTWAGA